MRFVSVVVATIALNAAAASVQSSVRFTPTPIPSRQSNQPPNSPCGNQASGPQKCLYYEYCQPWDPNYYQCRSLHAKCGTQRTNVDFPGNDIRTVITKLPDECCQICAVTPSCHAFTFVNYNPDGQPRCYLKTTGGDNAVAKIGAVSAVMTKCKVTANRDIEGSDMFRDYTLTASQCCDKCVATSGCKGFAYVDKDRACYLKSGVKQINKSGVTAGVVIL